MVQGDSFYIKGKDIENKDLLYDPSIHYQVMMEWEKPYMKKLVQHVKPKGRVLEIGFGLGYSSNEIQKYDIESHTIIEPIQIKELKAWSKKQKHKVNIVKGYWQQVLKTLGTFDTIFFDDAPTKTFGDPNNIRVYKFFYSLLNNHVNKNANFTWYLDKKLYWLCHPDVDFTIKPYKINVPKHCNYAKGNILYLPLIKFKDGIVKDENHIALNNNFQLQLI
jgi:hypothetical protein|tara:strand:+ start:22 stop:681 length:660 start_codon:yes stop_codon:yes gene_type:complete